MANGSFSFINMDISTMTYIMIGMGVLLLILLITVIVCIIKIRKMFRLYDLFMRGKDAETLEDAILEQFDEIKKLKAQDRANKDTIKVINKTLSGAYQRLGLIKYDAFKGMGGKMSFSLALLDQDYSGIVMNSVHSREGCYTYVKEVTKGETTVVLSNEEKEALEKALS